MENGFL